MPKEIICKITDFNLNIAKNYILNDQLVAFPTETVYGLGANAFSDDAIRAVYAAKGRPLDNPIIVHVCKEYAIEDLVFDNDTAKKLRNAFLPGPLTIVYESRNKVSSLCSCGLTTLALRVPSHDGAQLFLKKVGVPIAAPSANISKHTSPVTAEHVYKDFGNGISMILDGGRCDGGIESTVLDVTGDYPVILRKGLVTAEMIKSVVGKCEYASSLSALNARSPGTKYRHYCPQTQTVLFGDDVIEEVKKSYDSAISEGKTARIMCKSEFVKYFGEECCFDLGDSGEQMAARLYYYLRESEKYDILFGVKFKPKDEIELSVENRFLKAFG